MHYYQFNIGDYAKHTRHLTNNEDLAYRRMLDLCYLNEEPFDNDLKKVARVINMRGCEEEVENVLNDFFELRDGKWHNNRVEKDLGFYADKAERARQNGRKGGRPAAKKKPAAKKATAADEDNSPIMAYMPLTGKATFELRQSQTDKWAVLYPAVDLSVEVNKMIGWLDANPTKRKTKTGITKFMNSWLSKVQDQGGNMNQQQVTTQQSNDLVMDGFDDVIARADAAKQRRLEREAGQ